MGAMAYGVSNHQPYSGADQRKHQSSASLAFVWGIHRWVVNSPHKWPVTRKMFPFDVIMINLVKITGYHLMLNHWQNRCWHIVIEPLGTKFSELNLNQNTTTFIQENEWMVISSRVPGVNVIHGVNWLQLLSSNDSSQLRYCFLLNITFNKNTPRTLIPSHDHG